MNKVGTSTLYTEKYRPQTVKDLILPAKEMAFLNKAIEQGDISNILLCGSAGLGKSSTAFAICNDLDADKLFINASMETGIDTLRYKVQQFAMTSSFSDGKKIVILDEADRLTPAGQDALKALIEQTESNCRFIITTNNIAKIIDPIKSRVQLFNFNFNIKESESLMVAYFKRVCWILDNEKVKYDKKTLAEFVKKAFPDFRRTLGELQKYVQMHGCVDEKIFTNSADSSMESLVEELRNRKFNNVRKIATSIDADSFYGSFYLEIDKLLVDACKPSVIMILADSAYKSAFTANKELELVSCLIQLMKECNWK